MMHRHVLWLGIALVLAYWPLSLFLPGDLLISLLRAVQIIASVIVIAAYAPFGLEGLRHRYPNKVEQLALAITVLFTAIALNGLWFLVWRLTHRPEWMTDSFIHGFTLWLVSVSSVLYISAASALQGGICSRKSIVIATAFVAGIGAVILALVYVPGLNDAVEAIRPFLQR